MALQPPTPDDIDAAAPLIGKVIDILKWVLGTLAAALIASWRVLKFAGNAGREQRKYEEIAEDIAALKAAGYITLSQHDQLQAQCQSEIKRMVENQVHGAMTKVEDQLSDLKGTVCYFMGAMGIKPPDTDMIKKRRRGDIQPPPVL
jgi:gas vesicle protein